MVRRRLSWKAYMFFGAAAVVILTWSSLLVRVDKLWRNIEIKEQVWRSFRWSDATSVILTNRTTFDIHVQTKLSELAMAIRDAKVHARGTKTSDYLRTALGHLDDLLDIFEINKTELFKRHETEATSVCPEKFLGSTYGYPFFYKGFEETSCGFGKSIKDLVTVIAIDADATAKKSTTQADSFIKSVMEIYPGIPVKIATHRTEDFNDMIRAYPSVSLVVNGGQAEGELFNGMVKTVNTQYVLVARTVNVFTNDSRLNRLVREIERMGVAVSGGAWRDPKGHWSHGCYQSVYRNFTLKYVYGYDESMHECLFCDHVTGPFITGKVILTQYPFKAYDINGGLFEEWFLRLQHEKKEAIVCPDSMFYLRKQILKSNFKDFMWDMKLFKLQTVDGKTILGNCGNTPTQSSTSLSPCKVGSNAALVKSIMSVCEKSHIFCELQEGTALGAVKFGKVLPWERDGDITFLSGNYTAFEKLEPVFLKEQLGFKNLHSQWCCADNRTAGGIFKISSSTWTIELYGQHLMDTEMLVVNGFAPTRVLLDGQWVNVPRNPGLFVRNRYGREVYQHALHWHTTGAHSGWAPYKTNMFMKCLNPGSHDCLDRYNADGSLPFEYIIP